MSVKEKKSLHDYAGFVIHPTKHGKCNDCQEEGKLKGWAYHPDWDSWGCPPDYPGAIIDFICDSCWRGRTGSYG